MRNILIILFLLFTFVSCTSCNSSSSGNDSEVHDYDNTDTDSGNDTADKDSDTTDTDIERLDDDSDETSDMETDDEWERDIDIPEMSDNPYWEEYPDSDKNIAYHYYGDAPVKASDPEDVKALWSKICGGNMCEECTPAPYDLCAENYPFEAQIINGSGSGSKFSSTAGEFQCDALLTAGKWYTNELANSVQFSEINGKVLYSMTNGSTSWQGGGTYAYDINTRKVERIGRGYLDGWQNSRYYFVSTFDYRIDSINEESIYYGPRNRHLLYYDKEEKEDIRYLRIRTQSFIVHRRQQEKKVK